MGQQNPLNESLPAVDDVTSWLAQSAEFHAQRPALEFNRTVLSYGELDYRTNRTANYLIRQGIAPGHRVGLCMHRSIEMVVALIGILKAGAAYVPLDPDYPPERLKMMAEDACLRCMLIHAEYAGRFESEQATRLIWEEIEAEEMKESGDPVAIHPDPEDTAYVIFTSGSTGRPKGIEMPHRALANLIAWQLQRSSFKPAARVLQYSSISFDVSLQEIATTLASGGTLVLISNEERKDPRTLLNRLIEGRIDRLFLPYVAMRSMIEAARVLDTYPVNLSEVITAGEQLRVDGAVRMFFSRIEPASLDNQYGPSETHVITAHLLDADPAGWPDLPPIGVPLTNNRVYILDEAMQPVDAGEIGELYLAGRNLAHGYLNQTEQTRRAFIPNPPGIADHSLYKTGDLGTWNEDGTIAYLGRKDHQVKIRGHRVEPGEVSAVAARFPGIEQSLTHPVAGTAGEVRLATWYTVKQGTSVDPAALRRHLSDILPEYMVPFHVAVIDNIPYTPSGKVDLKALPDPSSGTHGSGQENFRYESETEEILARIWSEVLEINGIPREVRFSDLGGDSLRAVSLFLKISEQFDQDLPLAAITQAPTLAALARRIDEASGTWTDARALQLLQPGVESRVPLVLVHGGKGNVLVFSKLVENLGPDIPVYGLQWPGWDGRPGQRTIPAMARLYADELIRVLPRCSVRLGGYCIGGLIAMEMAVLLEEKGVNVEGPLLIWDTPNIKAKTYHRTVPWNSRDGLDALHRIKDALLNQTAVTESPVVRIEPEPCADGLFGFLQRLPYLRSWVQWIKARRRLVPVLQARLCGRTVPLQHREDHCLSTMLHAVKRYAYPRYAGSVLFFRSHSVLARDMLNVKGWWEDSLFGFEELCTGPLETVVVGRSHGDIMNVQETGDIIRKVFGMEHVSGPVG